MESMFLNLQLPELSLSSKSLLCFGGVIFLIFPGCNFVEKEDDGDIIQDDPDMEPVKSTAFSQMEDAITALSRELAKLRTGRASAGTL